MLRYLKKKLNKAMGESEGQKTTIEGHGKEF